MLRFTPYPNFDPLDGAEPHVTPAPDNPCDPTQPRRPAMLDDERSRFSHPDVELGEIPAVKMDGPPQGPPPPPPPPPPSPDEPLGSPLRKPGKKAA